MRQLILILMASVLTMMATQPSEARRGGSKSQELHFVSSTTIPGAEGKVLSLCHLSTKNHIFGIGLWRSSDGYALSDANCEGEQYFTFTAAQFAEAQEQGLIDASISAEPKMTMNMIVSGFSGLVVIGLLLLLVLVKYISSLRRKKMRRNEMGDASVFHKAVLDVMCHAALSDGEVEATEITLIQNAARDLTGKEFAASEIEDLVRSCDKNPTPAQFKAFGKGVDITQSASLVRAALMVIAADGDLAKAEQKFISGLATGLGISNEALQQIIQSQFQSAES